MQDLGLSMLVMNTVLVILTMLNEWSSSSRESKSPVWVVEGLVRNIVCNASILFAKHALKTGSGILSVCESVCKLLSCRHVLEKNKQERERKENKQ